MQDEEAEDGDIMNHAAHRDASNEGEHESSWLLLPWLANGTLEGDERLRVETHLAACARCRRELARCRDLAAALRAAPNAAPSPHPVQLARLMARLPAATRATDANGANGANDANGANGTNHANATDETGANAVTNAPPRLPPSPEHPVPPEHPAPPEITAFDALNPTEVIDVRGVARTIDTTAPITATEPARAAVPATRGNIAGARPSVPPSDQPRRLRRPRRTPGLLASTPRPVRLALAGQLAAVLALALALAFHARPQAGAPAAAAGRDAAPLYHTLSAPSSTDATGATTATPGGGRPQIRILFTEQATERQIREILMKVRGRLVDGPSPLGTYTVEIAAATEGIAPGRPAGGAPDSLGIVLGYLTSQPIVRFAEPVAGTAWPPMAPTGPAPPAGAAGAHGDAAARQ